MRVMPTFQVSFCKGQIGSQVVECPKEFPFLEQNGDASFNYLTQIADVTTQERRNRIRRLYRLCSLVSRGLSTKLFKYCLENRLRLEAEEIAKLELLSVPTFQRLLHSAILDNWLEIIIRTDVTHVDLIWALRLYGCPLIRNLFDKFDVPPDDVAGVLDALECRSFINCLLDTKLQSGGAIDVLQLLITTDRCEIAKRLLQFFERHRKNELCLINMSVYLRDERCRVNLLKDMQDYLESLQREYDFSHKFQIMVPDPQIEDISAGRERFPVPVFNQHDHADYAADHKAFSYSTRLIDVSDEVKSVRSLESRTSDEVLCSCSGRSCGNSESNCLCNSGVYNEQGLLDWEAVDGLILECTSDCACSLLCNNRVAQKGAKNPVKIFRSTSCGWGVRAADPIPCGAFIGEYTGEVLADHEANISERDDSYFFETRAGDTMFTVDAKRFGNFTRFINHSCDPNAQVLQVRWDSNPNGLVHLCLFALRDIQRNEQITISYGEHWWKAKINQFTCKCQSQDCLYREPPPKNWDV